MNTLTTTRRKPDQKRPLFKPLSLALLDDAERLLFFVIDVILLAICAVRPPVPRGLDRSCSPKVTRRRHCQGARLWVRVRCLKPGRRR